MDGTTWEEYGRNLEEKLQDLHDRIHRGAYRALPGRRQHIPKADGGRRALSIAALEDKIVQRAVVHVLNRIYEEDFLGFSYGFRPGRSQHDALDALFVAITRRKVGWILDADIAGFFDNIDQECLMKFVEHRLGDRRIHRLIRKWRKAGVMEEGLVSVPEKGTPQGSAVSPLLANVYLHYALDLWANQWRKRHARGDVIIVRYADDFVVGFQYHDDAQRFWAALAVRLEKFALSLHADKTRLLQFGRFAASSRAKQGLGKPETFTFLGFTHIEKINLREVFSRPGGFDFHYPGKRQNHRCPLWLNEEIAVFGLSTHHVGGQGNVNMFGVGKLHCIHVAHEIFLVGFTANAGIECLLFGNRTDSPAVVVMAGINQTRVGQRQNLFADGVIQRGGIPLLKIRAAASADQEGVAGEGAGMILRDVGQAAVGVSWCCPDLKRMPAE